MFYPRRPDVRVEVPTIAFARMDLRPDLYERVATLWERQLAKYVRRGAVYTWERDPTRDVHVLMAWLPREDPEARKYVNLILRGVIRMVDNYYRSRSGATCRP